MGLSPASPPDTSPADIDRALAELAERATPFARSAPSEKAAILRELLAPTHAAAPAWVTDACLAKGLDATSSLAGEEWFAGPFATLTNIRLLAESLEAIHRYGRPRFGWQQRARTDGRREVRIHPRTLKDTLLSSGTKAFVLFEEGVHVESDAAAAQAAFYGKKDPEGGIALVLAAGNVSSIPPMDALYKLFVEGRVVLLKMNPVNAYLGPHFERAFEPLLRRGVLRIVYGGAALGGYLAEHPSVAEIHITGSDRTHDLIVWGPPGPERDRRKAENDPLLKKPITSELGNVSPVIVAPYLYSQADLTFVAKNIATQVVNNGSFNCNAAKMLVLPKCWAQREKFIGLLKESFAEAAPRQAYYPGARERYEALTRDHERVVKAGAEAEGAIPFTLVLGLDPSSTSEPLFTTEPFCGILSEVSVGSDDPPEFLAAATAFCNDRLWGTLSAGFVIPPILEEDPAIARAFDAATAALRYGAIAVNHWPGLVYGLVVPPWGGHPSASLSDVQSGMGWVHNTLMLGRVEKAILRGSLRQSPKPPIFYDNKKMREVGQAMTAYAAAPTLGRVLSVAAKAITG